MLSGHRYGLNFIRIKYFITVILGGNVGGGYVFVWTVC